MALAETVLRTTPQYWTAAIYKQVPGRGLVFQGWMPTAKLSWNAFLGRLSSLGASAQTMPYYWDGARWVNDRSGNTTAFFHMSGEETQDARRKVQNAGASAPLATCDLQLQVGALQRANPLPPGRYWQDIFAKQANAWNAWLAQALKSGAVTIEKVEHFNRDPLHDGSWLPNGPTGELEVIGDRTWVLFNVVRPVDWPATKLGFPTIADATVQQSSDTVLNPPGPTPADEIKEVLLDSVVKPAMWIGGGYLAIKLLLGLRR